MTVTWWDDVGDEQSREAIDVVVDDRDGVETVEFVWSLDQIGVSSGERLIIHRSDWVNDDGRSQ
jgi:hypothetical protein